MESIKHMFYLNKLFCYWTESRIMFFGKPTLHLIPYKTKFNSKARWELQSCPGWGPRRAATSALAEDGKEAPS